MPADTDAPKHPEPLSYGIPDAGRAIGVSRATIWRLVAAGEIKTFKLGNRTLIKADELRAFVERKAAVPPEPSR
jgi:excisionase family DNA binding protein